MRISAAGAALIFMLLGSAVAIIPVSAAHAATQSQLTVKSRDTSGNALTGYYTILYDSGGSVLSNGYTPVKFHLTNGLSYSVRVDNYGSCNFDHWAGTGSTNPLRTITITSDTRITAVYNCGGGGSGEGGGGPGTIRIYDHRVPASYWDPCFAITCTNPLASCGTTCTGPGASMWVVLYDSAGKVVATGFSDENGLTFTGLSSTSTYYLYPADCDLCHGSTHDVLFDHWGDKSTNRPLPLVANGAYVDAWYTCTNGCGGT